MIPNFIVSALLEKLLKPEKIDDLVSNSVIPWFEKQADSTKTEIDDDIVDVVKKIWSHVGGKFDFRDFDILALKTIAVDILFKEIINPKALRDIVEGRLLPWLKEKAASTDPKYDDTLVSLAETLFEKMGDGPLTTVVDFLKGLLKKKSN